MILQPFGTTNDIVNLNVQENNANIDMTNYASGVYNFVLICDGDVMDVKSIQKQ